MSIALFRSEAFAVAETLAWNGLLHCLRELLSVSLVTALRAFRHELHRHFQLAEHQLFEYANTVQVDQVAEPALDAAGWSARSVFETERGCTARATHCCGSAESTEVHTLHFFDGACPGCAKSVSLSQPVRLRHPYTISCPSCQYELPLSVDL